MESMWTWKVMKCTFNYCTAARWISTSNTALIHFADVHQQLFLISGSKICKGKSYSKAPV